MGGRRGGAGRLMVLCLAALSPTVELRRINIGSEAFGGTSAQLRRLSIRGGAPEVSAVPGSDGQKRIAQDAMKLMRSGVPVQLHDENSMRTFSVLFYGPKDTAYEGGVWKVNVELPVEYPFKSPSIGFANKIFHPNVDEASGSVCLDVINQSWKPFFDLTNIFDVFLPQLLTYPNPSDPLNGEAAALALRDTSAYDSRIRQYVKTYASSKIEQDFVAAASGSSGAGPQNAGKPVAPPAPSALDINTKYSESATSTLSDDSS